MRRLGFTTIELLIVIVLIGVIVTIGFPRIRRTLDTTNVRSARVYLGTAVATARGPPAPRGRRGAGALPAPARRAAGGGARPRRPSAGPAPSRGRGRPR